MDAVKQNLISQLGAFAEWPRDDDAWLFKRLGATCPSVNLLDWLNGQASNDAVYLATADKSFQVAGIGRAREWDTIPDYHAFKVLGMPCFSLHPFDSDVRPEGGDWGEFVNRTLFTPQVECYSSGRLVVNIIVAPDQKISHVVESVIHKVSELQPEKPIECRLPVWTERQDRPDESGWNRAMETVLGMIDQGDIKKAVLARETQLTFPTDLSPLHIMKKLIQRTPGTNHFLFASGDGAAFLGATPELLFSRNGQRVCTQAVAATRPRGETDAEDARYTEELLGNDKEQYEHKLVADMIEERLKPLCTEISRSPVDVMKLVRLQHLYCEISGILKDGLTDGALVEALHPTPAVGGVPQEKVLPLLRTLEPFERGCYASPVGVSWGDNAQFMVAIRSALIVGDTLRTYAGAGIVKGSESASEWNEVESKIGGIRGIFEHE